MSCWEEGLRLRQCHSAQDHPGVLAEEERRLPPWLGEDEVSPRPTSGYQYLCGSEEDEDEGPNSTQGEAGGDRQRRKILEDFEGWAFPCDPSNSTRL